MARGDIMVIDLPAPAGSAGHEQVGFRPAVVVQTDVRLVCPESIAC